MSTANHNYNPPTREFFETGSESCYEVTSSVDASLTGSILEDLISEDPENAQNVVRIGGAEGGIVISDPSVFNTLTDAPPFSLNGELRLSTASVNSDSDVVLTFNRPVNIVLDFNSLASDEQITLLTPGYILGGSFIQVGDTFHNDNSFSYVTVEYQNVTSVVFNIKTTLSANSSFGIPFISATHKATVRCLTSSEGVVKYNVSPECGEYEILDAIPEDWIKCTEGQPENDFGDLQPAVEYAYSTVQGEDTGTSSDGFRLSHGNGDEGSIGFRVPNGAELVSVGFQADAGDANDGVDFEFFDIRDPANLPPPIHTHNVSGLGDGIVGNPHTFENLLPNPVPIPDGAVIGVKNSNVVGVYSSYRLIYTYRYPTGRTILTTP